MNGFSVPATSEKLLSLAKSGSREAPGGCLCVLIRESNIVSLDLSKKAEKDAAILFQSLPFIYHSAFPGSDIWMFPGDMGRHAQTVFFLLHCTFTSIVCVICRAREESDAQPRHLAKGNLD